MELSVAGVVDCKLRCFNHIQENIESCGQNTANVYANMTKLPEKERKKFCFTFYPFPSHYVKNEERNECYEVFDIEVSKNEIYESCSRGLLEFGQSNAESALISF